MKKSNYTWTDGYITIKWEFTEYQDYCFIKEINNYDGMNYISIPKKLIDKIFRKEDS